MKKFLIMALMVLGMSFASCTGHKTSDETLGVSVDSTEVVTDSLDVVVDTLEVVEDTVEVENL